MLQGKLPSDVVNQRQQYLNSVTRFIDEESEKLTKVLDRLGVNPQELLESEEKQICPFNKDHVVPEKSFKKHVTRCKYLCAGYQKDELPTVLQDVDFCYESKDSILKIDIDENVLNKIIWDHCVQNGQVYTGQRTMPVSHIDENIYLTQEDRLAVYRHVVARSHEAGKVISVDRNDELLTTDWGSLVKKGLLDEQNNKQYSSKLEQLAALRDMKRRRQSYRAKNVHITKKSYTEIIREVISNQMEILAPESSSYAKPSTSGEDFEDSRDESRQRTDNDGRGRDRGDVRDWSPREKRRERDRDDDVRSRDRHRGRYQDSPHWQSSRDQSRDNRDRDISRSSRRSPDISRGRHRKGSPQFRSREFSEGEKMLKEVKRESVTDSEDDNTLSVGMRTHDEKQDEATLERNYHYHEKSETLRKRRHSDSESDSSDKKRSRKKSKHKKKHSKKHKRKD